MDEECALTNVSRNGEVRDGPRSFFLRLEIATREVSHNERHETRIDHSLNLCLISSCDVRQEPHSLFVHLLLRVLQQCGEIIESAFIQHGLSLLIGAGNNITNSTQSCSL